MVGHLWPSRLWVDADLVVHNEALESTMQRDLRNSAVERPLTVWLLLARRYWRSKVKLLRLYRLVRAVIENILWSLALNCDCLELLWGA
jgi:hypothetical protein